MGVDSSEAHLGEGPCGLQSLAGRDRCPGPACLGLTLCPERNNDPVEVRGHATINFSPVKKPEESRHRVEASSGVPYQSLSSSPQDCTTDNMNWGCIQIFLLSLFMKEWPCRSIWSKTLYMDGKKQRKGRWKRDKGSIFKYEVHWTLNESVVFSSSPQSLQKFTSSHLMLNLYLLKLL